MLARACLLGDDRQKKNEDTYPNSLKHLRQAPVVHLNVSCMNLRRFCVYLAGIVLLIAALVEAPRVFPVLLEHWHPEIIFSVHTGRRVIYLTIDDAPSVATKEILAVLSKHDVHATFFVIGSWVHDEGTLSKIVASGSHIGHHMWTTEACSKLDGPRFEEQFDQNDHLLQRFGKSVYFRPPSDFGTGKEMAYVRSRGYRPILGTVFPVDSSITSVSVLKIMVKWLAVPGGILIMHDGRQRGFTTADVLDQVIPYLKNQGYQLEPLPEAPEQ